MSRSLLAYSARSSVAEGGGVRRRYRETISIASAATRADFERRSRVNNDAMVIAVRQSFKYEPRIATNHRRAAGG
jgi:hypothetical protein